MKTIISQSGVKTIFNAITVDNIKPSINGKTDQAQLSQVITKEYPSTKGFNSLADGLFAVEDLGSGASFNETRVAWVTVPTGIDEASVLAQIQSMPDAVLYKILSNNPILTEEQNKVTADGFTSEAFNITFQEENGLDVTGRWNDQCAEAFRQNVADRQVVKNSEGTVIEENGKKVYRRIEFSKDGKSDVDYRVEVKQNIPSIDLTAATVKETASVEVM